MTAPAPFLPAPAADQHPLDPARLIDANINPVTHLATDYLNHFNEIVMALELVPDVPDMIEDVRGWRPKSYPAHFSDSGFAGKDLAIAAYERAPLAVRRRFEDVVATMDALLAQAIAALDRAPATGRARIAGETAHVLLPLIEAAAAIINGTDDGAPVDPDTPPHVQAEIDALIGG